MGPLRSAFRERFPALYLRGRNAVALAQLYADGFRRSFQHREAYDEAFWDYHSKGDWQGFAQVVIAHLRPRSVVDIGCGQGLTLAGFASVDPTLQLCGFDDSEAGLTRARRRGLTVDRLDIIGISRATAVALAQELAAFDAVVCLEVAEHLPPWHSGKLLTMVTAADHLIFSAARPQQGGSHHVNEQPAEYWIGRLGKRGFRLSRDDDEFRRKVAALDLPPYYAENVHLFERQRPR